MEVAGVDAIPLGNMWLTVATIAYSALNLESRLPAVLQVQPDGELRALRPDHPDYSASVFSPGFACTISEGSDLVRIAARIRSAAMAAWPDAA